MTGSEDANGRWSRMLSHWAIPDDLVAAAPQPPYFFDPQVFIGAADEALARPRDSPSDEAARMSLPSDGTVLDVGCGAGAASLRLRPGLAVGVDPSPVLLDAFVERARRLGIDSATLEGSWPSIATQAPICDVVVCHHVFYNVADLATFASALTEHARSRVVVELTAVHPMAWMIPYWRALHGIEQPERPVAEDAVAVLAELGLEVRAQTWSRRYQMIGENSDKGLLRVARRMCLASDRHDELRRELERMPPPVEREMVTLWW